MNGAMITRNADELKLKRKCFNDVNFAVFQPQNSSF